MGIRVVRLLSEDRRLELPTELTDELDLRPGSRIVMEVTDVDGKQITLTVLPPFAGSMTDVWRDVDGVEYTRQERDSWE